MIKYDATGRHFSYIPALNFFKDIYGSIAEEFWWVSQTGEAILNQGIALTKLTTRETIDFIRSTFFKSIN